MSTRTVRVAFAVLTPTVRVFTVGTKVDASDPVITGREHLFTDAPVLVRPESVSDTVVRPVKKAAPRKKAAPKVDAG